MQWETLPVWFWIIYYLFLLMTIGTAIFSMIKKKHIKLSILTIFLTITTHSIFFLNSFSRTEGMNEFEFLFNQILHGNILSILVTVGYILIFAWWILFLFNLKRKEVENVLD